MQWHLKLSPHIGFREKCINLPILRESPVLSSAPGLFQVSMDLGKPPLSLFWKVRGPSLPPPRPPLPDRPGPFIILPPPRLYPSRPSSKFFSFSLFSRPRPSSKKSQEKFNMCQRNQYNTPHIQLQLLLLFGTFKGCKHYINYFSEDKNLIFTKVHSSRLLGWYSGKALWISSVIDSWII